MSNDKSLTQFQSYYLKSFKPDVAPIILHREVLTIGRSDTCDVKIASPYLSHVHASIFYNEGDFYISDLNSTNGTFVNDERIKVIKLKTGDFVRFGAVKFQLLPLVQTSIEVKGEEKRENTLETVNPLHQSAVLEKLVESVKPPEFTPIKENALSEKSVNNIVPSETFSRSSGETRSQSFDLETTFAKLFVQERPITPLDIAPSLNYSEFIFEENAEGRAIDFVQNQPALEITIFINDFVVSVDYFLSSQKNLYATGKSQKSNSSIMLPFLPKESNIAFLNYHDGNFGVYDFTQDKNWDIKIYGTNGIVENFRIVNDFISLKKDYIVTISREDFIIVIKHTDSPPKTLPVPWLIFDAFLKKVLFFMAPAYVALVVGIALMPKSENDFDEQKMEEDRIVYVKELPPTITPKKLTNIGADKSLSPAPSTPSSGQTIRNQKIEEPIANKSPDNSAVSIPPVVSKQVSKPVTPPTKVPPATTTTKINASKVVSQKPVIVNEQASESVPPRLDVKALQSKLEKKFESTGVASNVIGAKTSDELEGAKSLVGTNSGAKVKDVGPLQSNNTGAFNVSGADTGDLGKGKSISSNLGGDIGFFDGTGGRKEILGIMDPTEVQNILRRYIPQFQFCYEKELERINKKVATTLILQFTINSEGLPINVKFDSKNMNFTPQAIKCFEQVVYNIQFSKPKGGGVVGIKQPLNMEPRF